MTNPMQPEATAAPAGNPAAVGLGPVAQILLFVRDIDRAVEFYRDTLGLLHLFTVGPMAFFDASGTRLYLQVMSDDEWRPGSILYFLVDDISASYDALLDRGVETAGAPHLISTDEASGIQEWMAFFDDADGNTLALLSRVRT